MHSGNPHKENRRASRQTPLNRKNTVRAQWPDPTTRHGIRDRAMLHLCFSGGLRVSELIGLRMDDLKLQPQATVMVHGKGRKQRCLPLWKETAAALRAWLTIRGTVFAPGCF